MDSRINYVRIRIIMPNNVKSVKLKFEPIESIGSQPPLIYWLSNKPLSQFFFYGLSLLILVSPFCVMAYGYFANILLMQQIGFFSLIPAIVQYTFVNEALTTIKYIENAEACRVEHAAACNKISSLQDNIDQQERISNQMKEEIASLLETRSKLSNEVQALRIIKESGQKNSQAVDELTEALQKFIEPYKAETADLQALNGFVEKINEMLDTLKTHGHQIRISSQDHSTLKGLLFQFFALPENYVAQTELSSEIIGAADTLIEGLANALDQINKQCIENNTLNKTGTLNKDEALIVEIAHKTMLCKGQIEHYRKEALDPTRRATLKNLNDRQVTRPQTSIAGNLFGSLQTSFLNLMSPQKDGGP